MQKLLTEYSLAKPSFCWWDDIFTDDELDYLQDLASYAEDDAFVGDGVTDSDIRRSKLKWINYKDHDWVFDRLSHIISSINTQYYRFRLDGFGEAIQLTNYDSVNEGTYNWHQDFGANCGPSRKLSIVMQLSCPSQYEGGNLEIMTGKEPEQIEKKRGLITIFPSYTLHRVTPVTAGTRQSLVAWITGPEFT